MQGGADGSVENRLEHGAQTSSEYHEDEPKMDTAALIFSVKTQSGAFVESKSIFLATTPEVLNGFRKIIKFYRNYDRGELEKRCVEVWGYFPIGLFLSDNKDEIRSGLPTNLFTSGIPIEHRSYIVESFNSATLEAPKNFPLCALYRKAVNVHGPMRIHFYPANYGKMPLHHDNIKDNPNSDYIKASILFGIF